MDAAEHVEDALVSWVYPQRKLLTNLVESGNFNAEEMKKTLGRLAEAACKTLAVERTSIWRILPNFSGIECLLLYERTPHRHSLGPTITQESAPNYFKAIAGEHVIAAHDARTDPRTSEFREAYLEPLGITSMLDAPVFVRGEAVAVICHEHIGAARRWQFWEELVASTFADFVALVLDAESRVRDGGIARAHEAELQKLVSERTEALSESEKNLQALLDSAPIPLALLRAGDRRLIYANQRALQLFDAKVDDLPQLTDTSEFWVRQEDRADFAARLLSEGRFDDIEVELRSTKGRRFWARMSAKTLRFRGELTLVAGMVDITEQRQAKENFQQIFTHAPIALVCSRLSDQVLLDGNARAASLFEVVPDEQRGRTAPDFWVHPEDRDRLREQVRQTGRVDAFEAKLRTSTGRQFWAELSAGIVHFDGEPALLVGSSDITERKKAAEAVERRETHLRTLLDAAPSPLIVTGSTDGLIRYANPPALSLFEYTARDFVGRPAPDHFVDKADRRAFLQLIQREGRVEAFTAQLRTSTGRKLWVLMNARATELDGEPVFMTGLTELTAQKELEQKLRELATTDELTGAHNRRYFFDLGEIELRRTERYRLSTSLAMLDVDHFKQINDRYGHAAGDSVLREIASIFKEQVRTTDIVARIGGEEFALLFPETPMAGAGATVERIRRVVAQRKFAGLPDGVQVTISAGLVEHRKADPITGKTESLGEFLSRADDCLYLAKTEGRNQVSVRPRRKSEL